METNNIAKEAAQGKAEQGTLGEHDEGGLHGWSLDDGHLQPGLAQIQVPIRLRDSSFAGVTHRYSFAMSGAGGGGQNGVLVACEGGAGNGVQRIRLVGED